MKTLFALMKWVIESALYFDDKEDSDKPYWMNRRWRWWLECGWHDGAVYIGVVQQMVQFKGVPEKPRTICYKTLYLVLNPFRWSFRQDHDYYDGPNCWYHCGPFGYARRWGWCTKCMPDDGDS